MLMLARPLNTVGKLAHTAVQTSFFKVDERVSVLPFEDFCKEVGLVELTLKCERFLTIVS